MSRLYEDASSGAWLFVPCARCDGLNQRRQVMPANGRLLWWWANQLDTVCAVCRDEVDAEEQEAHDRAQQEDTRD